MRTLGTNPHMVAISPGFVWHNTVSIKFNILCTLKQVEERILNILSKKITMKHEVSYIAINTYIKKLKGTKVNDLMMQLKYWGKQEQNKSNGKNNKNQIRNQ